MYRRSMTAIGHRALPVAAAAFVAVAVAGCGSSATTNVAAPTTSKCQLTMSPSAKSFPSGGGTGSVAITVDRECSWTATSDSSWLTFGSTASGQGNGNLAFTVGVNPAASGRSGDIHVNDQHVQISEDAAPCRFQIEPTSDSVSASGGGGSVSVSTLAGCAWSASSGSAWVTLLGGGGTGNASVSFSVAPNTGTQRSATLTVAGLAFDVDQASGIVAPAPIPDPPRPTPPPTPPPTPCQFTVSPASQSMEAVGGSFTVTVRTAGGCNWTATSQADWLTIAGGASGSGNGSVSVSAAANTTTASRTGTLLIAGQGVSVTEAGLAVIQLEGVVSNLSGSCPSISFVVNGTTVVANGDTVFSGGNCGAVANGTKIHVTGVQQPNGTVTATAVQIQK